MTMNCKTSACTKLALLAASVRRHSRQGYLLLKLLFVFHIHHLLLDVTLKAPKAFNLIDEIESVANSLS